MKRYPSPSQYLREASDLADRVFASSKESQLAISLAAKVHALAEATQEEKRKRARK